MQKYKTVTALKMKITGVEQRRMMQMVERETIHL